MSLTTQSLDRAELLDLLAEFTNDARELRRRGYVGTASAQYAEVHAAIDELLDALCG